MRLSRLYKKIFAASMAIFMFVGEVGNLPPSSALAKQTDVVQSVENAANSNILASEMQERFDASVNKEESESEEVTAENEAETKSEADSEEDITSEGKETLKPEDIIITQNGRGVDFGQPIITQDGNSSAPTDAVYTEDENNLEQNEAEIIENGDSSEPEDIIITKTAKALGGGERSYFT